VKIRLLFLSLLVSTSFIQAQNFSLDDVKSYPFPNETAAASNSSNIVWALNEEGKRNLYGASGPDFKARMITNSQVDDGQEHSSVSISADGKWVVYILGGDFGSNWNDAGVVNPTFDPNPPKVQIWSIPFKGGKANALGEGESPVISPDGKSVVFRRSGQLWLVPIDGKSAAKKLFSAKGSNGSPIWSADGKLAFVSSRGDHSFIGVYADESTPIQWIDPSFKRDNNPRWSPDGKSIAFVRRPGGGGEPQAILEGRHNAWKIMTANVAGGKAKEVWKAPETIPGSYPSAQGGSNLHWADGHIVFLSYQDGWQHLYSVPENGGAALLLTPGNFMAEYISMSPDKKSLVFAGNTGPDDLDIERRHIVKVSVNKADMKVLTPGTGLEWFPHVMADNENVFYVGGTAKRPPLPGVMNISSGKTTWIGEDRIPSKFPTNDLVVPTQVVFNSIDGTPIHATMFRKDNSDNEKPAIIYIHGGPPRQMMLGWHYSSYYSNAYAMNQYLASQGFVVISVNYRLGVGYGYDFHRPIDGGTRGASEYQDIKAAALWLRDQSFVDDKRIGVYGGSYGGYLTAMALGRDSELFAAGVDIHGVHERTINRTNSYLRPDRYERVPDAEKASLVAWESSPVADVATWTSPALIIHADDDRNVQFSQSTDLVKRLEKKGVEIETLVIVDDTHHFMMHKNQMTVNKAIAEYFKRKLGKN
jgi:dipeptidyl aminopeptidase/acylaminoacyl peptidase